MPTQDLLIRFIGLDAGVGREFDSIAGKATTTASSLAKFGAGAAVAAGVVAAASIKMASDFQSSTELIHTQAGASQAEVDKMRGAILSLAGQTATAPEQLSVALYHIESTGARGAKALEQLKIAAEGAQIGQANLEDVTNALNATVVSGIGGTMSMAQAMGALNAVVGAGDMHMQDLADALGTGVLAVLKGYGVTLTQAGAALAVFGDNNIRGALAANQLRMAVQALTKPAVSGADALAKLGLTGQDAFSHFATDLQHGGLTSALSDLVHRLIATGNTGNKVGQILTDAFGKRAGVGLSVLVEQFGRYELKLNEVTAGAKGFGNAWSATTKNLSFQFNRFRADIDVIAIRIGNALIPAAMAALHGIEGLGNAAVATAHFFQQNQTASFALAGVLGAALIPKIGATAMWLGRLVAYNGAAVFITLKAAVVEAATAFTAAEGGIAGLSAALETLNLNPIVLTLSAIGAVAAIAWERDRAATAKAKQATDEFVQSLDITHTSLQSMAGGLEAIQAKADSLAGFHIPLQNLTAAFGPHGKEITDLAKQYQPLNAQLHTAQGNVAALGKQFGLTTPQIGDMAVAAGIDLTKPLSTLDPLIGAVVIQARLTHHPLQQAAADFANVGSKANTVTQDIQSLDDAFNNLVGNFVGMKQATLDAKNQLVALDQALKKSHDSLSLNTSAGRQARGALLSLVPQIKNVVDATYNQTGSYAKAERAARQWLNGIKASGAAGPLVRNLTADIEGYLQGLASKAPAAGHQTGAGYGAGIAASQGQVMADARRVAAQGLHALQSGDASAHAAGENFGGSYASGIAATAAATGASAAGIVQRAISAVQRAQQSHSPSKVALGLGGAFGQGYWMGVKAETPAARKVGQFLAEGLRIGVEDRAKILATTIHGTMAQALSALKSGADKMLTQMRSDLSKAQSAVKATQSAMVQLRQSDVQSLTGDSALSNITGVTDATTGSTMPITSTDILTGLQRDDRHLHHFLRELGSLRKQGLSKALYNQILAMGPDQGQQYTSALLAEGLPAVQAANRSEQDILSTSRRYGVNDAQRTYGHKLDDQTRAVREQTKAIREQTRILRGLAHDVGSEVGVTLNHTAHRASRHRRQKVGK